MVIAVVAIVWGVGGVALIYYIFNWFVEQLPRVWTSRLQPFVFVGPALVMLIWFLALPALRTLWISFFGRNGPPALPVTMLFTAPSEYITAISAEFAGLANYLGIFSDRLMLELLPQ